MSNARNISKAENRFVNATGDTISGDVEVLDPVSSSFTSSVKIGSVGSSRRLVLSQDDVLNYSVGGSGTGAQTHIVSGGTAGVGTTRMTIDDSGRVTMPYQPAFRAHTFTPTSGVGTIVYTVAAHNIGSHYNTSTGRFTAPVAGVYHFDFSVLMGAGSSTEYIRVLFSVNGAGDTRNGDTLTGGPGVFTDYDYHAVQMSHSFYLNANDTVEVKTENPDGQTYQSSGGYGSFSGYLIG